MAPDTGTWPQRSIGMRYPSAMDVLCWSWVQGQSSPQEIRWVRLCPSHSVPYATTKWCVALPQKLTLTVQRCPKLGGHSYVKLPAVDKQG